VQSFTNLEIWKRSYQLALSLYRLTEGFPPSERYAFTSQLRRAAVSVPTNIAEGCKRRHSTDFARFLNMSEGSLGEMESLLMMAGDLAYADPQRTTALLQEVKEIAKMVCRFRQSVEARGPIRMEPGGSRKAATDS